MTKITGDHLARSAYVYVRQSSIDQLLHNPESRRRQYALTTRACALGWTSRLDPDVVAVHVGAGTSGDPRKRELLFHAAQETYIRKWFGGSGWFAYRSAACLGAAARTLVLAGERRAEAARRALLYLRGPRRCAMTIE